MPKNKKPKALYRLTCKSSVGDWDVDIYRGRDYEAAQEWARNMRHTMLQLWRDGAVIQEFMPIYRITASTTAGAIIPVTATPPESAIEKCAREFVKAWDAVPRNARAVKSFRKFMAVVRASPRKGRK